MLRSSNGTIDVNGSPVPFVELPALYEQFLRGNRTTQELERRGEQIRASGCTPAEALAFVKDVCAWGGITGTNRVWPRIHKHNTPEHVTRQLEEACRRLSDGARGRVAAIQALQQVVGLGKSGAVSYASKHLRMVAPEICVTLDSNLATTLVLPENPAGFEKLCAECEAVAQDVNRASPAIARPRGGPWRAADIEACVFTKFYPDVVSRG